MLQSKMSMLHAHSSFCQLKRSRCWPRKASLFQLIFRWPRRKSVYWRQCGERYGTRWWRSSAVCDFPKPFYICIRFSIF